MTQAGSSMDAKTIIKEDLLENARRALPCTCQLFYQRQLIGSGVLLQVAERRFLVSARHVLPSQCLSGMMIPNGEDLIGVEGFAEVSRIPPDSVFREDRIDITVVELKPEIVQAIGSRFSFLDLINIQIDHALIQSSQYMICGYPNAWTKQTEDGYEPTPLILRTKPVSPSNQMRDEFPDNAKLFVAYEPMHRDVRTGETVEAPPPVGISGSGLWFIDVKHARTPGNQAPKLVGIITHSGASENLMVATRIEVVTEVLRQRFQVNVPAPATICVNIH